MKNNLTTALIALCAFGLGTSMNNFAMSNLSNSKIACVDINKLALSSNVIKNAQEARDYQTKELLNWYDNASLDIQKQETQEAKKALTKKYENQLTQKQKTIKEQYNKELKKADTQMADIITSKSKEMGYNLVFRKDALLFGGEDITSKVLPYIK